MGNNESKPEEHPLQNILDIPKSNLKYKTDTNSQANPFNYLNDDALKIIAYLLDDDYMDLCNFLCACKRFQNVCKKCVADKLLVTCFHDVRTSFSPKWLSEKEFF